RWVERCLGQFYVTFDARQMSPLEMSNLRGAGERGVADAEVENSRNQTVNPHLRIFDDQPEDTLRLGIEQPAGQGARVAADIHQGSAAPGRTVTDIAGIVVVEGKEHLDRPEFADLPSLH